MRIRKKKWARPELAACPFYVHEPKTAAGTWGERFKKQQPIHLDLGCGKCTFLAKLAHREKDVNFIGIDIRFWASPAATLKRSSARSPWKT